MAVVSGTQLQLELQPGLLTRYATVREALHHSVLNDPRGLKAVAADCDISVSELSRRLAPSEGDPRSLDVNLFDAILQSTGDLMPLHWLMAKHLADVEVKQRAALAEASRMLPELMKALAAAGLGAAPNQRRAR